MIVVIDSGLCRRAIHEVNRFGSSCSGLRADPPRAGCPRFQSRLPGLFAWCEEHEDIGDIQRSKVWH